MEKTVQKNIAVILPSLDPDNKFIGVVDGLKRAGFEHVVIVDDGSDDNHQAPFSFAESVGFTVIHHGVNKGKGRALKTAFAYVSENLPECCGVITIDGDGQHLTKDIIQCSQRLIENPDCVILGCRDFDQPGVPPRSVAGNKSTRKLFKVLFGINITDTQTGLRAIPGCYLKNFCEIEGERFEYETNMLLQMNRQHIGFIEQPIETVYDPDDYSSHYNAVKDSLKVAKVMAKYIAHSSAARYACSSVLSYIFDVAVYYSLLKLFGMAMKGTFQIIGNLSSSLLNFNLNKFWVFRTKGGYWREVLEYYCIAIPRSLIGTTFTLLIQNSLAAITPGLATLVKILVEAVMFVAVYFIQKKWVFKTEEVM